jgi:hypothetical protein
MRGPRFRTSRRPADAGSRTSWSGPVAARPAGFYIGGVYYRESPEPRQRRHQADPAPVAAIPLPVPRPHFPGDATPAREAQAPEPASKPAPPAAASQASPETPPASGPKAEVPPMPPQKPAILETPSDHGAAAPTGQAAPAPAVSPEKPAVAGSGASNAFAPRSPDADPDCPTRLAARHVEAEPIAIGPQPDERCTVVQPVRLGALVLADGTKVDFPDKPTIACTTADVFSSYVRDLLVPLSRGTFASPVAAVWTGPGLECRARDHIFGAKLSAHGQGLAIDIAQLKLADGRVIAVGEPKSETDSAFETASRAAGCGYFHTVLGPGSDSYHRTHWHFDLEVRGAKGDSKFCK